VKILIMLKEPKKTEQLETVNKEIDYVYTKLNHFRNVVVKKLSECHKKYKESDDAKNDDEEEKKY